MLIGTCSLCGGPVEMNFQHSIVPTPGRCQRCGAEAAGYGPVIPMQRPVPVTYVTTDRSTPLTQPLPGTVFPS